MDFILIVWKQTLAGNKFLTQAFSDICLEVKIVVQYLFYRNHLKKFYNLLDKKRNFEFKKVSEVKFQRNFHF